MADEPRPIIKDTTKLYDIALAALAYRQAQANYVNTVRNFKPDTNEAKTAWKIVHAAQCKLDDLLEQNLSGTCALCLKGHTPKFNGEQYVHQHSENGYLKCEGTDEFRERCQVTVNEHIDDMFSLLGD